MQSFDVIKDIIKQLLAYNLTEGIANQLIKCIDACKTYLQSQFGHKLSNESNVASHCALHAVSDPDDPDCRHICTIKHTQSCAMCELLQKVVASLEGIILATHNNGMHQELHDEYLHELRIAHKKIWHYKCQIVRAYVQSKYWDDIMSRKNEDTVYLTLDYAMKW